MAGQQIKVDKGNKILMFIAAAALAATLVFMLSHLAGFITVATNVGRDVEPDPERIAQRMAPVGHFVAEAIDRDADPVARASDDIYQGVCAACHDSGAAGAPMLSDRDSWLQRIDQGLETVIRHAIEGFNGMPARGGDSSLSDEDVARTVAFMLDEADVDFDRTESPLLAEDEADAAPATDDDAAGADGAAESSNGDADEASGDVASSGDAQAGRTKYASCIACHGAQGQGMGIFPTLAGQDADAIAGKLTRYRAGEQLGGNTALMYPHAVNLSDDDIANLAAYVETL